jgi:hypothetical protein
MRTHARQPPPTVSPSTTITAAVEECRTPKQRMEARKRADADARMQQVNLHVHTNLNVHTSARARKQQMMSGSLWGAGVSNPSGAGHSGTRQRTAPGVLAPGHFSCGGGYVVSSGRPISVPGGFVGAPGSQGLGEPGAHPRHAEQQQYMDLQHSVKWPASSSIHTSSVSPTMLADPRSGSPKTTGLPGHQRARSWGDPSIPAQSVRQSEHRYVPSHPPAEYDRCGNAAAQLRSSIPLCEHRSNIPKPPSISLPSGGAAALCATPLPLALQFGMSSIQRESHGRNLSTARSPTSAKPPSPMSPLSPGSPIIRFGAPGEGGFALEAAAFCRPAGVAARAVPEGGLPGALGACGGRGRSQGESNDEGGEDEDDYSSEEYSEDYSDVWTCPSSKSC